MLRLLKTPNACASLVKGLLVAIDLAGIFVGLYVGSMFRKPKKT